MNYKLIKNSLNDIDDILGTVLLNRNIPEDQHMYFIKPMRTTTGITLDNINEAVECLLRHIENDDEIAILVDCDADGFTSAACLYMYLKKKCPHINLYYVLHTTKVHGLSDPDITFKENTSLIITPDSGSNDFLEHKMLKERGIDVIVLDHHECDIYSDNAIVVNNKMSEGYFNKELSGVGVVYRFLQELDKVFGSDDDEWDDVVDADYFLDLVAIGVIADNMALNNQENIWICSKGLKKIHNPLIKQFIEKMSYSLKNKKTLTPTDVAFSIAPKINAVIRRGVYDEIKCLFDGMINGNEEVEEVKKDGIKVTTKAEVAARKSIYAYNKSSTAVKNMFQQIVDKIESDWDELGVVGIVDAHNIVDPNYTGLVANKLASHYKRPILLFRMYQEYGDNNNIKILCRGSGRNCSGSFMESMKDELEQTGMFNFVSGHANAFGFEFDYDRLSDISSYLENKFKDVTIDDTYEVDFIVDDIDELDFATFRLLDELSGIWGKQLEEPLFVLENVVLNYNDIKCDYEKNYIKYRFDNMELVKFNVNRKDPVFKVVDDFNYFKDEVIVNIVCYLRINEYNGIKINQINVVDWQVV